MSKTFNSLTPEIISYAIEQVCSGQVMKKNGRVTDRSLLKLMEIMDEVHSFHVMALGLTEGFRESIRIGLNPVGTIALLVGTGFQIGFHAAMAVKTNDRQVAELESMVGLGPDPKPVKKRAGKRTA